MLFNSLQFLLFFLPLSLLGYHALIALKQPHLAPIFLILASLGFYAAWNPVHVPVLLASVLVNHRLAHAIAALKARGSPSASRLTTLGIVANVAVLGYYKYANFFLEITGTGLTLDKVVLPLAISFYTIQQVAFLIDVSRGDVPPQKLLPYATFVLFFPRLIAGPIVRYREVMPQFKVRRPGRFLSANLTIGLVFFAIGLFKKTVIAVTAADFATPIFAAASTGQAIPFTDAWTAVICYTLQLYFDFSGYSDMAIGIARMFGIILPMNFHSPLKAASIIDYWRRWHMTLQRFIGSYVHQPIVLPLARFAANRGLGKWQTFAVATVVPTIISFILVGFWHGAAWTFILFGLMHGLYLSLNEFWRQLRRKARRKSPPGRLAITGYHLLTLTAVMVANVIFRAPDLPAASAVWTGMASLHQFPTLFAVGPQSIATLFTSPAAIIMLGTALVMLFPNTQQLLTRYRPVLEWPAWVRTAPPAIPLTWRPTAPWAIAIGLILLLGTVFILRGQSEFIYFNF